MSAIIFVLVSGLIVWGIYLYSFITSQEQYSIYDLPLALPSVILDTKGRELYSFFEEKRTVVQYSDISPLMIDAMVSTEDKNFWSNDGFDPQWILRSTLVTLKDRRDNGFLGYSQGASTLTQQIIKNTVVGKDRTMTRKLHEIVHAWVLTYTTYAINKTNYPDERRSSLRNKTKEDIITYYLNSTFFGNNAYGIEEAAQRYFDISSKDLSLQQSAILAAIPKSPYNLDPYRFPDALIGSWQMSIDGKNPTPIDRHNYASLFENLLDVWQIRVDARQQLVSYLPRFEGVMADQEGQNHQRSIFYAPWRKDYVIQRLREDGRITHFQALEAIIEVPTFALQPRPVIEMKAPHFVYRAKKELLWLSWLNINEQQLATAWYTITTTIDLDTESELERIVNVPEHSLTKYGGNNRAVLVVDTKNWSIIGYVASKDFRNESIDGQVDLIDSPRQVGSALKPLIYAYALSQYPLGLDSTIRDTRTNFGGWYIPRNADGVYKWSLKLKNALPMSRNVPALKLFNALGGQKTFVPLFQNMGMEHLDSEAFYGLPMALWTAPMSMIDLMQWFLQLSDMQQVAQIHSIDTIVDRYGMTIYDAQDIKRTRIIPLGVARLVTYMLQTAEFWPSYFRDTIRVPACPVCASKTGTSSMKVGKRDTVRDAWLMTYGPDVSVLLRAWNTNGSPLTSDAYGYKLNTALRNDIVWSLTKKSNYAHEWADRKFPSDQTKEYPWQGEGYRYPKHDSIPQEIRKLL